MGTRKQLAGVLFVYNGQKYDYCYLEAIECLIQCTDQVFVIAGGEDETFWQIAETFSVNDVRLFGITTDEWEAQKGKEKLSYFTNIAIEQSQHAEYDYVLQIQADEVLHENSYKTIRTVIESGCEGYMCKRINLWGTPNHQLNVPISRMPCSTEIVRLTKTKYRSWDDAENIRVDDVNESYTDLIEIWHYGFVRKADIMKQKVINMQENVFGMNHDPKLDGIDYFDGSRWFSESDLKSITKPHPKIMEQWVKTRP